MRFRIPAMVLVAAAVLCAACVTPTPNSHRLELDKAVAIALPDGFYYKARLAQGKIIGGGPETFFDRPGLLIVKSTPELTYLFVAELFEGTKGLGEVTLIYGKAPFDLVEIRQSIASDLDSFVENEEKVAAPGSDGNKVVQRLSLAAREIDGYPAVEHEMITLSSGDLFNTEPTYQRTLEIFRPDGLIRLQIEYSRTMPPDSEGTPMSWAPKDSSPLLTEPEAGRKLDALVRSVEVVAPPLQ